ncbi:preprotein translocase subunit SecG [Candidatus Woesebacteria bacterium]|nr:preprotein translocase subunit SecG [Candidatus Woesebacteria bacterium]
MHSLLIVLQIITSISLVILILIQPKGTGLGRSFGSGTGSFTRRGLDKAIYKFTFLIGSSFLLVSALSLIF